MKKEVLVKKALFKKEIIMKKLIYIICFTFLSACTDPIHGVSYPFSIVNNASHSIGLYVAWGKEFGKNDGYTAYPDTTLPMSDNFNYTLDLKIGRHMDLSPRTPWEEIFKKLPADTLSIFIFHTDTLKKYSWQEVRDGYKVLKRYDLSLEDIKRMNYTITYP